MLLYRRTYISRLLPVTVGPLAVVLACLWLVTHQGVLLGTAIGLGMALYLFASLTVTVTDSALAVDFGPGLIGRRIPLAEIVSCAIVRESAWFGHGVTVMRAGTSSQPPGLLEVALAGGQAPAHRQRRAAGTQARDRAGARGSEPRPAEGDRHSRRSRRLGGSSTFASA